MKWDLGNRDIAFLLSLAAMPVAGCPSDSPAGDGTDGSSSDSSGPTTTMSPTSTTMSTTTNPMTADDSGTTTAPIDTGSSDTDPTTTSTDDTTTTTTTTAPATESSSSEGDESSSSGGSATQCEALVDLYVECLPNAEPYARYILGECTTAEAYYAGISAECSADFGEFLACISGLGCEAFGMKAACPDESAAFEESCALAIPECGDGIISNSEDCDGQDLDGTTCADVGLVDGVLACDPETCQFDTSMCE